MTNQSFKTPIASLVNFPFRKIFFTMTEKGELPWVKMCMGVKKQSILFYLTVDLNI